MRIAVVSDIHANLTAFDAVIADLKQASPDLVVHGGDLVGSGSSPADVIDRVRDLGWPGVQGNCEEMLWNPTVVADFFSAPSAARFRDIVSRSIGATLDAIGDERLAWLRALPDRFTTDALTVVHASPGDRWRAPAANATDDELATVYGPLGGCVVYGHIHRPYVRQLRQTPLTIANAGSVSLSYDGDPRASYALVDGDRVTIRRVRYEIEREAVALAERHVPDADWIAAMLRAGTPLPPPAS